MSRLEEAWIWLRRIGHCRGFGIQSPTDYRFVRYVVNEHWPYYAYQTIGQGDTRQRRRLGRLYFRLANYLQPTVILDLLGYGDYLRAGCRRAVISHDPDDDQHPQLILAPATHIPTLPAEHLPTAIAIEGIGKERAAWDTLLADSRATIAFDLYYCGIVFFDPQRAKQTYIVNF